MHVLLPLLISLVLAQSAEPPTSWIDPDTGHRVVRLTTEPGSASLYFNQNGYTPDGTRLVYTTPNGISTLDLRTHQTKQVVTGRVRMDGVELGPGDIAELRPGEPSDFLALTDATVVAVKLPAVAGDKYLVED